MKTIALTQVYNEELFIEQYLHCIYPLVNQWIITEGKLTPFVKGSQRSTDNTRAVIENFIAKHDKAGKIKFLDAVNCEDSLPRNREEYEGLNKNWMLSNANIDHGDLIFIGDCDEFFHAENFLNIIEIFKQDDKIVHVPIEEYQFAYGSKYCFKAEHNGRFMRYLNGSKFGSTNHFFHPDGKDITKDYTNLISRDNSQMCHMCWSKNPNLIRDKVLSFNRLSFTTWFNYVYLLWPENPACAYENNSRIAPYHGKGFAEGQSEKLFEFNKQLPEGLENIRCDWTDYIKRNKEDLKICI